MKNETIKRLLLGGISLMLIMAMSGCQQPLIPGALDPDNAPAGQGWIKLFNGKDLSGWHPRKTDNPMSWTVVDGAMVNTPPPGGHGVDIVSDQKFEDFEVYYEYAVPQNCNSGMYLRGRYEIQILEDGGANPGPGTNGGIWATAAPRVNASKPAGEWQSVYARIVGKTIEVVVLNGTTIHENVNVPKPTGGHLDENVDQPGPIMVQGDHGKVRVRQIWVRPL